MKNQTVLDYQIDLPEFLNIKEYAWDFYSIDNVGTFIILKNEIQHMQISELSFEFKEWKKNKKKDDPRH